jgi:hypothetical protein
MKPSQKPLLTGTRKALGLLGAGVCVLVACEGVALRGLGITSGSDLYGDVHVGSQADFGILKGVDHIHACTGGDLECKGSLTVGRAPVVGGVVGEILKLVNQDGNTPSDITSLEGMQQLRAVDGDFTLVKTQLVDLTQVPQGMTVGGQLEVSGNDILKTLDGMDRLASVGGNVWVFDNGGTEGIPGIPQEFVNLLLTQLLKLDGVTLAIQHNGPLHSLRALPRFVHVKGHVQVALNSNLVTLEGLEPLQEIDGDLVVLGNPLLDSLDGLSGLLTVHGNVKIQGNPVLLMNPDRVQSFLARVHVEGTTDLGLDGGFPTCIPVPDGGFPPGFDAAFPCP